jgi:hypothetical protein
MLFTAVPSVRLDSLGPYPFRRKNPPLSLLDFLGFPWILSCETRLINGLHGKIAQKFFASLFLWRGAPEREHTVEASRKRRLIHGTSLVQFPFFRKRLSSELCLVRLDPSGWL